MFPVYSKLLALISLSLSLIVGCAHTTHSADGESSVDSVDVVIVGGGLAGLVTAYEAEKRGLTTQILEARGTFGGRVHTARYGRISGEAGLQEIWESNPLLGIARELGIELDGEAGSAYTSMVLDGKLYPYIQDSEEEYLKSFLSDGERESFHAWMKETTKLYARIEGEGLSDPEAQRLQKISFGEWIGEAQLPEKVEAFIRLTLECELATEWDTFSALYGLLELGFFLGESEPNYHIRGGNSRLVEVLESKIRGKKLVDARVSRVVRSADANGQIRVQVHYEKNRRMHKVDGRRVVIAVPFIKIHQIQIEPTLSEAHWDAIRTLGFGSYVVVHYIIEKSAKEMWLVGGKSPLPYLSDGPLGVIYGVTHEGPKDEPFDVFSLLVHGGTALSFHIQPHEKRVEELTTELDKLWPGFSTRVRDVHVYQYHPAAVAVWPPGRSPLDEGSKLLREPSLGLYFAGDWTENSHSDGAAESAIRVANAIARELGAQK